MGRYVGFRKQFNWKYFGFHEFVPRDFTTSTFNITKKRFIIYRCLVFVYWSIFLLVDFIVNDNKAHFCLYLSHWNQVQLFLYFGFALTSVLCGTRNQNSGSNSSLFAITGDESTAAMIVSKNESNEAAESPKIRWFHVMTSIMFVTSLIIAVAVTVMYATTEWRQENGHMDWSVGTIHLHFVNSLLILIDLIVNNIPVRLLHFVYTCAFTFLYCLFLYLIHVAGVKSDMYKAVDWGKSPMWALGFSIGMTLLIAPCGHLFMYVIYYLKHCVRRYVSKRQLRQ